MYPQGNFKAGKATLYFANELFGNVAKVEVRNVEVIRKRWAQYAGAAVATFRQPRQRKDRQYVGNYKAYLVVLEGWGHPNPDGLCGEYKETDSGALVAHSRYSSCSDGYANDFDLRLQAYLVANPEAKVLGDYRHTQGFNAHDATAAEPFLKRQRDSIETQLLDIGIPTEIAEEVAHEYVFRSPHMAAGLLCNTHDVMATVTRGRHHAEALGLGETVIEPEPFF